MLDIIWVPKVRCETIGALTGPVTQRIIGGVRQMSERPAGGLSDRELTEGESAEHAFRSPVPTQIVSNGEYNPLPQTEKQRQVEGLIKEYADKYSKKQGIDRRTFLKSASGMAAAFLAMNQVFGPIWNVSEAEAADKDMADERAKKLS